MIQSQPPTTEAMRTGSGKLLKKERQGSAVALNIKQLLIRARTKIENPEQWQKQFWAMDADGMPCDEASEQACSFCAYGAVKNVLWNSGRASVWWMSPGLELARKSLEAQIPDGYPKSLVLYNDSAGVTHQSILKLFDRAIESL